MICCQRLSTLLKTLKKKGYFCGSLSDKFIRMSLLSQLNPQPVWTYFEEICKIPRLSKNEASIRRYLLDFASQHNLESKEDSAGNILIIRPASPGHQNVRTVVLQSHMDMVGEKNADYPHDWAKDPIIPVFDNEWVSAKGTTLGADDGIGIASQLAILTDKKLRAGKIECLFTADEESGMTGAINLKNDFFEGRTLLNLDSEDEGILFIGCAGGMDTVGKIKYRRKAALKNEKGLEISITGLHGGHSGDEIHKGYGNSVKLMTRILSDLSNQYDISLSAFNGGNLRNAIPREAFSVITVRKSSKEQVMKVIENYQIAFNKEFDNIETNLKVSVKEVDTPDNVMNKTTQGKLLDSLYCCPHGVIAWSKDMEDLVETSTNLASISFSEGNLIKIVTTQRSSLESSKHEVASRVKTCLSHTGAEVVHSDGYPAWTPSLKSEILKITKKSYQKLFGKGPVVRAIHAGLECGLIFEKFKGIDMISFGPTIRGAHTPAEKIEIKTVQMFWDLLTEVIKNIPPYIR
jgi:dipeptidase D